MELNEALHKIVELKESRYSPTEWESVFLDTVKDQINDAGFISPKQVTKLEIIYNKAKDLRCLD